jgi:primosomal replication protein N
MFKYTVQARLNKQPRVAVLSIKTPVDHNVGSRVGMEGFLAQHNVVNALEKVFGEGSVQECVMTEKTQMISCA